MLRGEEVTARLANPDRRNKSTLPYLIDNNRLVTGKNTHSPRVKSFLHLTENRVKPRTNSRILLIVILKCHDYFDVPYCHVQLDMRVLLHSRLK